MSIYNDQNIKALENALKNVRNDKPLYSSSKCNDNVCDINIEDVISVVTRQIKALQSSDCVNRKSIPRHNLTINYPRNSVNSGYVSSNKITKHDKFDTQNISNTQLINLVEHAEASDSKSGLMQIFNTQGSCYTTTDKCDDEESDSNFNLQHKFTSNDKILLENCDHNKIYQQLNAKNIEVKESSNDNSDFEDCTEFGLLEDLPKSPILKIIKPILIKRTVGDGTPIICDLDLFEKFEAIAHPIVEKNSDLTVARKVINTHLLDKELYVKTYREPALAERDKSPVIEVRIGNNNSNLKQYNKQCDSAYSIIDDDILFSSDEESDFNKTILKELPATCAMETSFYNETDVLDETMFVGFQTASNKSIEIKTYSYIKAQNTLADDEEIDKMNLEDIVNVFDKSFNQICKKDTISYVRTKESNKTSDISLSVNNQPLGVDNILVAGNSNLGIEVSRNLEKMHCHYGSNRHKSKIVKHTIDQNDNEKIESLNLKYRETVGNNCFNIPQELSIHKNANDENSLLQSQILMCPRVTKVSTTYKRNNSEEEEINDTEKSKTKVGKKSEFKGYQTASNRDIMVPHYNIAKSIKVVDDIDFDTKTFRDEYKSGNIDHKIAFNTDGDMKLDILNESVIATKPRNQTTNEKPINIKNDMMLKSGKTFDDMETTYLGIFKVEKERSELNKKSISEIHFQTASNKAVTSFEHSFERENTSRTLNQLQGFRTASNKEILISKTALAKTAKLFDDIDKDCNEFQFLEHKELVKREIKYKSPQNFNGFKTANNKSIYVSKAALKKSIKLFDNIDKEIESTESGTSKIPISTFQTVSNKLISEQSLISSQKLFSSKESTDATSKKEIKIPKEALVKNKNLVGNVDRDFEDSVKHTLCAEHSLKFELQSANKETLKNCKEDLINHDLLNTDLQTLDVFKATRTPSRKDIIISTKDAKNSNRDIDKNFNKNSLENKTISSNYASNFKFLTASNKPVDITEESLMVSQQLFNYIETKSSPMFKGFQTASRKDIRVSSEALAKSAKIFENIDKEFEANQISQEKCLSKVNVSSEFPFQTASDKSVSISKETLAGSQKLLNKEKQLKILKDFKGSNLSAIPNAKFQFQTASNKQVDISEESFMASQKLFNIELESDCFGKFNGFQTAGRKEIKISKEALAKTAKLFDNIDDNVDKKIPDKDEYKSINIYHQKNSHLQESLKAGHHLLNNIQCDISSIRCNENTLTLKGFQTASNKQVTVSAEALVKSSKVFDGLDLEIEKAHNTENCDKSPHKQNCKQNDKTILEKCDTKSLSPNELIDVSNILTTQVICNFEETLYTEDFCKDRTPRHCKRSGSPILSCPKPKKKKFEAPPSVKKPKNSFKTVQTKTVSYTFDVRYKMEKAYNLKKINDLEKLSEQNDDIALVNLNFDTLLQFVFTGDRNNISNNDLTVDDLKNIFLNSVNRKIVPEGWLNNHIQLIMWKLFSYEVRLPNYLNGVCSVKNILDQLKYRYDRELYNVERPALRKILERDDVPTKTLVLCVVGIYVNNIIVNGFPEENDNVEVMLSDGWYCIKGCIDKMLSKYISDGKITVGSKIVTHGAELVNCDQGMSPLEDISSVRLKIFGNSTRRARWDARLGYHGNAAILSQLSAVRPDGGKVSKLRVLVTRVYPMLYVEKFEDGSTVTRSERLECLHQNKYENERQIVLEKIYEDVEKEYFDQESQNVDGCAPDSLKMESGSQIARIMKNNKDPVEFRANLSESQIRLLQEYTTKNRERQLDVIQEKVRERLRNSSFGVARNVVPLLKIRIVSIEKNKITNGMISLWRPNDALEEIITEGSWVDIYNIVPTAIRYSEIQLSASRQTIFQKSTFKLTTNLHNFHNRRQCYHIKQLKNLKMITDYNEVDTVGIIFLIEPKNSEFESSKSLFQNIYLADENKNIMCINFWGGVKKFGFENILDSGEIVTCVNLQKRSGNTIKNIPQYRATEFSYFTKTPKYECSRKLLNEIIKIFSGLDRRKFCEDCCVIKNKITKNKYCVEISPYSINNSYYNISKNIAYIESPLSRKDVNLNLTGLDFESTFKQKDTQDLSPKEILRKRRVDDKITKLKMYGEPPPLSAINIVNQSIKAGNAFKSPITSKNLMEKESSNTKRRMDNEKENTNLSSPVLSIRTYTRPSVNPVKLNFSNDEVNQTIDPFADEFDASPPLSLD